ncbi:hypothetical protein C4588_02105 [Candidatus Parcubacteria bacterium]|nr:MAG: hypothetical protein C4588_02105 [Candidatus Parcubacteria bacterium]
MTMQTGYFANTKRSTKVHLVDENHKPICRAQIGQDMEYQWCARRPQMDYVECELCRKLFIKMEEKRLEKLKNTKIKHFEM